MGDSDTAAWSARPCRRCTRLNNLFNRTYYVSAYNSVWVTPGAPRSILGTLSYSF
ncbi:hypothetical protein [Ralstonia solanacearum]|uniref:hypothetical protein n=1 Tax=Ralstonia solanacearum TaxID=305 RepID=UPI00366BE2D9